MEIREYDDKSYGQIGWRGTIFLEHISELINPESGLTLSNIKKDAIVRHVIIPKLTLAKDIPNNPDGLDNIELVLKEGNFIFGDYPKKEYAKDLSKFKIQRLSDLN